MIDSSIWNKLGEQESCALQSAFTNESQVTLTKVAVARLLAVGWIDEPGDRNSVDLSEERLEELQAKLRSCDQCAGDPALDCRIGQLLLMLEPKI